MLEKPSSFKVLGVSGCWSSESTFWPTWKVRTRVNNANNTSMGRDDLSKIKPMRVWHTSCRCFFMAYDHLTPFVLSPEAPPFKATPLWLMAKAAKLSEGVVERPLTGESELGTSSWSCCSCCSRFLAFNRQKSLVALITHYIHIIFWLNKVFNAPDFYPI